MDTFVRHSRLLSTLVNVIILCAVAVAAYGFTLKLPLFWDDVSLFAWLKAVDISQILLAPMAGADTFRPLTYLIWKGMQLLQGDFDPVSLHLVNVLLHLANALLLSAIVARMAPSRRTLTGLGAGILFLLFPFAFQAIAPANSLAHPLHTALILAGVWTYLVSESRDNQGLDNQGLRMLSVVLAGASILAHENGILAPALITLTALYSTPDKPSKRILSDIAPYWVSTAVFFVLWRMAPRASDPLSPGNISNLTDNLLQNITYFVQAFAYPISWRADHMQRVLLLNNDNLIIALVSLPYIALVIMLASLPKRHRLALWSMAWFALAAAPAILMLPFNYTLDMPRLTYLASIGAAVFWAQPLSYKWLTPTGNRLNIAMASIIVVASAALGYVYVERHAGLYSMLGESITQLHEAVEPNQTCSHDQRSTALLVNYPYWYYLAQPEYLVGHDRILSLSAANTMSNLYKVNFGLDRVIEVAALRDIQPANADYVSMGGVFTMESVQARLRQAGEVIVSTGQLGEADMRFGGCLAGERQPAPALYQARLGDGLLLLDSSLKPDPQHHEMVVSLDWQALAGSALAGPALAGPALAGPAPADPTPDDVTISVRLIDASGTLAAQADGYPLLRTSLPRLWQAGDVWHDVRYLRMKGDIPAGDYQVQVSAYLTEANQRLPMVDAAGKSLPDNTFRIQP